MTLKIVLNCGITLTQTVTSSNQAQFIVADWSDTAMYAELLIEDTVLEQWSLK